jgi:hypothetical protein
LDYLSEERDICPEKLFVFMGTQKSLFGKKHQSLFFIYLGRD